MHHSKARIPPETTVALAANEETGDEQHESDMSYGWQCESAHHKLYYICSRLDRCVHLVWHLIWVLGYHHVGIGNMKCSHWGSIAGQAPNGNPYAFS